MNIERRKEMGLEIGRVIHMSKNQDELYENIMNVATTFCDKTSIACGMAIVKVETDELELGEDDETKEIIPE